MHKIIFLNFKFLIVLSGFFIILLTGCNISRSLHAVLSKKVKPHYYTFEDKSVIFTPLTHFGQKEFFDSLRDSILGWKEDGYTVFYEQIVGGQSLLGLDSISFDELQRKFRRIDGGNSGTAEDYAAELQTVFKKAIAQPDYLDLGLDSTDLNADISFLDLVNKLEDLHGTIELDSCDYSTHLDSVYNCSRGLKMRKLDPVFVDYRNTVLVKKIIDTELEKIVVLFGAYHIKGMKKLLKRAQTGNMHALLL